MSQACFGAFVGHGDKIGKLLPFVVPPPTCVFVCCRVSWRDLFSSSPRISTRSVASLHSTLPFVLVAHSRTPTLLVQKLDYCRLCTHARTNARRFFSVADFSLLCSVVPPPIFFALQSSVTLLKLNTAVAQDLEASLASSLVDLLAAHRPMLDRVIIAAAVQAPKRHQVRRRSHLPAPKKPSLSFVFFLASTWQSKNWGGLKLNLAPFFVSCVN